MPNKSYQKFSLVILVFLFSITFTIGGYFLSRPKVTDINLLSAQVSQNFSTQQIENKTVNLIMVGDIMLDRGVEYEIKIQNNWRWPFLKIAEELKKADIVFGNLEGPISDKGVKVGSIYSFRADPRVIEGLNYAGFNILSVANNHAFDYGKEALEDTFFRLKEAKIDCVGGGFNSAEAGSPVIKEINDTKIAFLAYTDLCPLSWKATEKKSGIACISEKELEEIKNNIREAKNQADIVIISLHSGEEYLKEPNQFQIEFSKSAVEAGANLIIGHHSHTVQKNEQYKDGWIFYSLGNFIFDQKFSEDTMSGQIIKIYIDNREIKEIVSINIKINEDFQPEIEK